MLRFFIQKYRFISSKSTLSPLTRKKSGKGQIIRFSACYPALLQQRRRIIGHGTSHDKLHDTPPQNILVMIRPQEEIVKHPSPVRHIQWH